MLVILVSLMILVIVIILYSTVIRAEHMSG